MQDGAGLIGEGDVFRVARVEIIPRIRLENLPVWIIIATQQMGNADGRRDALVSLVKLERQK